MTDNKRQVTTFVSPSTGIELELGHIATQLVAALLQRADFQDPPKPTYTVELIGGATKEFDHNEESAETEEERRVWLDYQTQLRAIQLARNTTLHHFMIEMGVKTQPPPPDEWGVNWERWGLEPPDPTDAETYKRRWIEEVVCPSETDLIPLIIKLRSMTGVSEERVKELEKFFRPGLAR